MVNSTMSIYVYICLVYIMLNVILLILNKININIYNLNCMFSIIISNLSVWNYGIIIDEFNLNGQGYDFYINIVNILIVFMGIVIYKINGKGDSAN